MGAITPRRVVCLLRMGVLDPASLAPGVYLLRIAGENFQTARKVIVSGD